MRLEPREFLSRVDQIGTVVTQTDADRRVLAALEECIEQRVRHPVELPWRPPAEVLEHLAEVARRQSAWPALDRFWFYLWADGLVTDDLRPKPGPPARSVEFRMSDWEVAAAVEDSSRTLWEGGWDAIGWTREARYLLEAVFAAWRSVSRSRLLPALARLTDESIEWRTGVVTLQRPSGGQALHRLDVWARLGLGRLELFYRAHPELRCEAGYLLSERYRRPGALAHLCRQGLRGRLPGGSAEWLRGMQASSLLRRPALFAHVQNGTVLAGWSAHGVRPSRPRADAPRRRPLALDQPTSIAAVGEARFTLRQVTPGMSRMAREAAAKCLEGLLPALGASECPPTNEALVTEWAITLLRMPKIRENTVLTWLSGMYTLSEELTVSVLALSADELEEFIQERIASQDSEESARTERQRWRQFLALLRRRYGAPELNWQARELTVPTSTPRIWLVLPHEVDAALAWCAREADDEALTLAVTLVLAFWCMLRRSEIAALRLDQVWPNGWGSIRIDESKTTAGRRSVPGALHTPARHWALVAHQWERRRAQAGHESAPLLVTPEGEAWRPKALGDWASERLRRLTDRDVSLHSCRRGGGTTALLRWAVALGLARWPEAWGGTALEELDGVVAALGIDEVLVLHQLAKQLGHSGPGVSVKHYIAIDLIEESWLEPDPPDLPVAVAVELLQVSRQAVYNRLQPTRPGRVNAQDVLRLQVERLTRPRHASRLRRDKR